MLTKSNNDFWKSWRSKFRNNANHNTRHISGIINDADISAKFADYFSGLCCSDNTTRCSELNEQYLKQRSTYIGYPLLDSHRFDSKLYISLHKAGIPIWIIALLANWYSKLVVSVRWQSSVSMPFYVRSGVR